MTASPLETKIQILVDTKEGQSQLEALADAFKKFLKNTGRSEGDFDAIKQLAQDLKEGKVQADALDAEMRELAETWNSMSAVAADRDILGLKAHIEAKKEIEATDAAYKRLKESGKLTGKELAQAAQKTEERIRELKKQTNGWAESLLNAKAALAGLGGVGAGLSIAAGKAITFESAMADVAKVVDGTDEQMQRLTERTKELSRTIPLAAEELAKIAAFGGQMGVPVDKLEEFVRLASQMSVAFGMTAEEAGRAMAYLSNAFGLPLESMRELGDAINVLGNTTAATEASIVEVLSRVSGATKQFGLSAEQAATLGATMLSMGVSSQIAGTGINALLSKLQTANVQSADFQNALAQIGISAEQLAADIQANPQEALLRFLRTLEKVDQASRAEILSKLFGIEYQDDISRLLNGLDQYEQSLARIGNKAATAGAMQKEFKTRVKTTEAQLRLLNNAVDEIGINLGSTFLPVIRAVVSSIGDIAHGIANIVDAFPVTSGIGAALASYAASASTLKLVFAAVRVAGCGAAEAIADKFAGLIAKMGKAGSAVTKLAVAFRTGITPITATLFASYTTAKALKEEFIEVEIAGVAAAKRLHQAFVSLGYAAEVIGAWFTDDTVDAAAARYLDKLDEINKGYGEVAENIGKVRAENGHAASASAQLKKALADTSKEAEQTGAAVAQALKKMNLTTPKGVADLLKTLDDLKSKAGEAASAMGETFENMSAADLQSFSATLSLAYEQGKASAQSFAALNEQVLAAAFKKLGVDGQEALGRIRTEAEDGIRTFSTLAESIAGASDSPEAKMQALARAGKELIASFKTTAELDAFAKSLDGMVKNQQIGAATADELRRALDAQRATIEQSIPGIQSVGEAFAQAGIKSRAELEKLAVEARERFEVIKKSGEATASGLRKAFEDWANAQAAAGMDMRAVEAQAAMLGLQVTVSETGQVTVQAMTDAAQATEGVTGAANAATDALGSMGEAAKAAADAVESAESGTRSGGLITWQKIARATGMAAADIQSYNAELQQAWEATRHLITSKSIHFNAQGVSQKISEELRRAVHEAKALDGMIRSMESGHASLRDIEQAAGVVASRVGEVGNERLDRLRTALAEVQGKMRALSDSARDALGSVRDELDQLRGNTEAVEKRRGEAQLAALKAQLKEAQEAGNREAAADLARAIKLQEQLNREKLKQVRESKADEEKRVRDEAKRAKEQAAEKDRLAAENAARERARNEEEHQRELARIAEQEAAKRREERQITQNTLLIEALNKIGHAQGSQATANPITINFNADGILDLSKGNVDQLARALVPRLNNLNRLGYTG